MTPPAGHVSVTEAAHRLGMVVKTLRRRIEAGYLRVRWVRGRAWVAEADLPGVPSPTPIGWRVLSPRRRAAAVRRRATA